jgi:predicted transcriptional regulator
MTEEDDETSEIGADAVQLESIPELEVEGEEASEESNEETATEEAIENNREEKLSEEDAELDEVAKVFQTSEVKVDRGTIKLLSRKPTCMRILKFLWSNNGDFYRKELVEKLHLPESTVTRNLKKLLGAKVVERVVPNPVNRKIRLYRVVDMNLASLILKRFLWLCSFKLAKTLPFNEITVENLQKLPKFIACRKKYFLSESEAVEALLLNKRQVQAIYSERWSGGGQVTGFRRLAQDKIESEQKDESA